MECENSISAESKDEILCFLRSQDISVPARTKGRTTKHCERSGVYRLLATLATANHLEYPITIIHRDKPDFLFKLPHHEVGLEFSEATSEVEAAIDAQAQHMGKSVLLFTDLFQKDMPNLNAKQKREIIENPPPGGPGWGNNRGVPDWVAWIMDCIKKKTGDYSHSDFTKYKENWLLVYDNLPIPFARDTSRRWADLDLKLKQYFSKQWHYDTLFVLSGNDLARLTRNERNVYEIADLWIHDKPFK
jgi:hypothetical protein